jgi:hypothetical protein
MRDSFIDLCMKEKKKEEEEERERERETSLLFFIYTVYRFVYFNPFFSSLFIYLH